MAVSFGKNYFKRWSWFTIFSIISWLLWKNRCKGVIEGLRVQANEVIHSGLYQVMDSSLSTVFNHQIFQFTGKEDIRWHPPSEGCVRLDVDGSVNDQGIAACGGLVRDDKGKWILGFQRKLGVHPTTTAEILALLSGLRVCKQYGFGKVAAYTDSLEAYHLVMRDGGVQHPLRSEISEIRDLVYSDWVFQLHYTPRNAIRCADYLAKDAQHLNQNWVVLPVPHPGCVSLMQEDGGLFML